MKKYLYLALIVGVFALGGCGRVSSPEPISGSGYPHTYPYR